MKKQFFFTSLICAFLNVAINAQDQATDTITMQEVVITGSRQYQSAGNVTQKIDVIASAEFQGIIAGNNNLSEAISRQPGASVTVLSRNDANWGTYAGIGPKYSTYMINGLPVDAFIDPISLDLMAFKSIEIQRGPASVLYSNYLSQDFAGNQSPLAGSVNMIIKDKINHRETSFLTGYGSFNTLNSQLYHQDRRGSVHYFAGVNFENSDYTNYGTDNSWLNMQKDPEYLKSKFFGGITIFYGTADKHKLQVFANKTIHKGDAGRVYRGFGNDYSTLNLSQSSAITTHLLFTASAGLRLYQRTWQESFFNNVDSLISNNGVDQTIVPVDVNIAWKHGGNHLLTVGMDYQFGKYATFSDPLLGYDLYGNRSRAYQSGIYAQEELRLDALVLRGGVRLQNLQSKIDLISGGNPGNPETTYNNLLWNAGVKYHLNPYIAVFANMGNSFIAPGLKSMGGTILLNDTISNGQLPNPDLKPESGLGADLGANLLIAGNMQVSLRSFYLKVNDAIVENIVSQNPSQSQSINAGQTTSMGVEVDIQQQVGDRFSWYANYTYMKTEVINNLVEMDGATVPFAPEHIANAGFNIYTPFKLQFTPALNYNGGYYDSSNPLSRNQFVPGFLINAFTSYKWVEQADFDLTVFIKAYNIANNQYEMPWQFKNTGLSVTGGFKVTLK